MRESNTTLSTSDVNKSRITVEIVSKSSWTKAGDGRLSALDCRAFQFLRRESRSFFSRRSLLPSASVRAITPTFFGIRFRIDCLNLLFSYLSHIFFEIPTKSASGTSTTRCPGMAKLVVTRGPFPEKGSLITCTKISWPVRSST